MAKASRTTASAADTAAADSVTATTSADVPVSAETVEVSPVVNAAPAVVGVDPASIVGMDSAIVLGSVPAALPASISLEDLQIKTQPVTVLVNLQGFQHITVTDDVKTLLTKVTDAQGLLGIKELLTVFEYADAMAPHLMQQAHDAAMRQFGLWKAFETMLARQDDFWGVRFGALLLFVHHNREAEGAFSDMAINRYTHNIPGIGHYQASANLQFLSMLANLCNPATRATRLKTIDWKRFMTNGVSEEVRARITGFFGV